MTLPQAEVSALALAKMVADEMTVGDPDPLGDGEAVVNALPKLLFVPVGDAVNAVEALDTSEGEAAAVEVTEELKDAPPL